MRPLVVSCVSFAYGVRPKAVPVAAAILSMAMVVGVIDPVIHVTRTSASTAGPIERFQLAWSALDAVGWDIGKLNSLAGELATTHGSYRETGSYFYPNQMNLDRFALILPVDQVGRALNSAGGHGFPSCS